MKENTNRKFTLLVTLVSLLFVVVVTQSFAILGFNKRLDSASVKKDDYRESIVKDEHNDIGGGSSLQQRPLVVDPFDYGFIACDWDPFKAMYSVHARFNQMLSDDFERLNINEAFDKQQFSPDIKVDDKGSHYLVTVDLPGDDVSSIDVNIHGRSLAVSGSMQVENREESDQGLRQERKSYSFQRITTLPEPVKGDEMKSENKDGVLHVEIPKCDIITADAADQEDTKPDRKENPKDR